MSRMFIIVAILSLLASQSAVAQDVPPKQEVGNWWVLKDPRTGGLETVIVKEIAPNGDFTLIDGTGKPYAVYTAEFNQKERGGNTFRPHNWAVSFPLTQGKDWEKWVNVDGPRGTVTFMMQGLVKGPEDVTLKLLDGTEKKFPATRVENTITVRNWPSKFVCWYVEEIRFMAKCATNDKDYYVREVVAWGKAGDPKPKY